MTDERSAYSIEEMEQEDTDRRLNGSLSRKWLLAILWSMTEEALREEEGGGRSEYEPLEPDAG